MKLCALAAATLCAASLSAQQVEEKDGVRFVHNVKGGKWGSQPEVSLKLVRTLGGIEVQDENLAFHSVYDVAMDAAGNIYVLDEGNSRIQKFSPEGKFLATIGRRGQGPGEFEGPLCFDIDSGGSLYVFEGYSRRIQVLTPAGKARQTIKNAKGTTLRLRHLKSGLIATAGYPNIAMAETKLQRLPNLIRVIDLKGNQQIEFGNPYDYQDNLANWLGNLADFEVSREGDFYVTFWYQNRIERFSPEGELLWQADRPLNYGTKVIRAGSVKRSATGMMILQPKLNSVSTGIAVDAKGRAWVATLDRQLTGAEEGEEVTAGGTRTVRATPDVEKIDAYKLEIFDPDGALLGEIKLDHRVHGIRIYSHSLFTWERNFDTVYQYEIVEK